MAVEAVPGDVSEALLRHLLARDGRVSGIEALRAVTSGASQEIWTFMACRGTVRAPLGTGQARADLVHWARAYRANGVARPVFEFALRWLADHAPRPVPTALVHGDFRNGNLVVDAGGVRAEIDWGLAPPGDPMEGLGWFCVNPWR